MVARLRNRRRAGQRLLRQTSQLRWSSSTINRIASAYSRSTRELASLPLPDLCRDVRSWSATGFQVVPATTLSLVRHEEAIEPKPIPPRLLAPYERGNDATLLARTIRLEQTARGTGISRRAARLGAGARNARAEPVGPKRRPLSASYTAVRSRRRRASLSGSSHGSSTRLCGRSAARGQMQLQPRDLAIATSDDP